MELATRRNALLRQHCSSTSVSRKFDFKLSFKMSLSQQHNKLEDLTSYAVDISQHDTQGFADCFPARRHKYETQTNSGCHEAREDWSRYIGSVDEFGNVNPINGNFTALVLPLCKPERLRLIAYTLECKQLDTHNTFKQAGVGLT
jgi:hypothetical protein